MPAAGSPAAQPRPAGPLGGPPPADHAPQPRLPPRGTRRPGRAPGPPPESDIAQPPQLINGPHSTRAARGAGARQFDPAVARLARTVQFVQLGAGARFDDAGRPLRLHS